MQLGLDPTKASSSGQVDANGQPIGDYRYATNRLAAQNVITITAPSPSATVPDADPARDTGMFTLVRGGFPLNTITVQLGVGGTAAETLDYAPLARPIVFPVGVNTVTTTVTPLAASALKTGGSVTASLQAGAGYTVGSPNSASVIIYPTTTPSGTGLTGRYYNGSSVNYNSISNFNPANLKVTRVDPTIDTYYIAGPPAPSVNPDFFSVRWTGQVQPQYSETYTFYVRSDEGAKLYVNGQLLIDKWVIQPGVEWSGTITLQAGVRYNLQLDYFENIGNAGVHLSWSSPTQPKQIIPMNRLYPGSAPAPANIVSPASAIAFVNQPFTYTIAASNPGTNPPTLFGASPLPLGLSITNSTNGVIGGIPMLAGDYPIVLTATNAVGVGASMLDLLVIDTGGAITRDVWTGVPGAGISSIPVQTPPSSTGMLTNLAGITGFGQDYGERIRGYLTAPVSGNYYFWIAASNTAELWISNDGEPANKVRRAYVTNGTSFANWTAEPKQISPWLALVGGQRYYIEILHKAGTGSGDNVAVGWLRPDQAGPGPSEIVPGFVLSPFVPPATTIGGGTLYAATMLPQGSAQSSGVGTATLRLSLDETQAILRFSYTNLSSPVTGKHIHSDPYVDFHGVVHPSQIIFDIDVAAPQSDGGYLWTIANNGGLSAAEIVEIIKESKAYLNVHTVMNPNGEIRGNFTLASGSTTFTPPPPAPIPPDDHAGANAAARFLIQAAFGPSPADIAAVQAMGYEAWIDDQLAKPASHHLPHVLAHPYFDPATPYPSTLTFNSWWEQSITAPDQLRQRVAFALSEIMVISDVGTLNNNGRILSDYYDTLLDNAFGNFRDLLETVTLTPAMGLYLDMRRNLKGDPISGRHPNENYAREIMQLFSVGLNRMWPDGTLVLDSKGNLVPTYDQNVIMGYARVFTGWDYHQASQGNGRLPANSPNAANYIDPMTLVPLNHELGSKRILDNVVLPAAAGNQADPTKPEFDAYCLQDLEAGHDAICNNPNVGPFICRELIQRLVTSNPSREYLYRVVQAFNDNGAGVRGDMSAVIKAILLDYEARSGAVASQPTFGKQREPVLRVTAAARAFPSAPLEGAYDQNGSQKITVTTTNVHRLANGDTVALQFNSGTPLPTSSSYVVGNVTPSTFTVNAGGLLTGNYTQMVSTATSTNIGTATNIVTDTNIVTLTNIVANTNVVLTTNVTTDEMGMTVTNVVSVTNLVSLTNFVSLTNLVNTTNLITFTNLVTLTNSALTVTMSGHGLGTNDQVYLVFVSGGASNGQYQVVSAPDAAHFKVTPSDATVRFGTCLIPKLSGAFNQSRTNITISTIGNHYLIPGDSVGITFPMGSPPSGVYQVVNVRDSTHFTVVTPISGNQAQPTVTVYPLVAPPLVRSGDITILSSTWNVGNTDGSLDQTPLSSPTVFNFFFPDYKFPGALASAGLTTPEFQLTSDTGVANQMNFLYAGVTSAANPNGFTSFRGGNGSIVLDLGPWITMAYTSDAGVPSLVDAFNSLLLGGQLSSTVRSYIISYVANTANFPYTIPTSTQMRDRARAVLHLILISPDFTIQK